MSNDPLQATNIYDTFDKIIRWITPFIAAIVGLIIFLYRSKVKDLEEKLDCVENLIKEEELERKNDISEIEESIETQYKIMRKAEESIIATFKEGLKEEREFRSTVLLKQSDQIEKIFGKLEELSSQFSRLDQKLLSHIENQERICKFNHRVTTP